MSEKITVYTADGEGSMDIDPTPRRLAWARGKGYRPAEEWGAPPPPAPESPPMNGEDHED